jgi:peptidoglycan/LPS O-acetylase OafA/YrhL
MVPRLEGTEMHDLESGGAGTEEDELSQDDSESRNLLVSTGEGPRRAKQPHRSTAFLDGLRGLAALLVYISHQHPWWYGIGNELNDGFGYQGRTSLATFPFIRTLFTGGNAGVAIFFVLSGYVLSIAPLRVIRDGDTAAAHRRLISAIFRRPFRLYIPALGISLAFALIMHLPFGLAPVMEWPVAQETLFAEIKSWVYESGVMMNPFEEHTIFTHWYPYDPPAWTMAIEFRGSMLVFSMLAVAALVPRWRLSLFSISGLFVFAIYQWSMACFMGGVVLAINDLDGIDLSLLGHRFSKQAINVGYNTLFVLSWWILCQPAGKRDAEGSYATPGWYYMTMLIPPNYYNDEYWRFWNSIGAVILVYTVLRLKWLQSFFTTRVLKYLGRVSFSLYLLHIPIVWTAGDRICRLFGVVRQPSFTTWYDYKLAIPDVGPRGFSTGFLASQVVILPLTLLLAEGCTRLLDEPSVRIGRAIVARLGLEKGSFEHRSGARTEHVMGMSQLTPRLP